MHAKRFVSVAVVALTLLALPVSALSVPIYYAASEALLDQVLRDMEIEYSVAWDDDGDPLWTLVLSEILITIVPYDKTAPGEYASLLFYAGWTIDTEIALTEINEWNRSKRFGRAYLDDLGDPVVELDLLLGHGVTRDTVKEYIALFEATVSSLGLALGL
jgi:hypothetical protein